MAVASLFCCLADWLVQAENIAPKTRKNTIFFRWFILLVFKQVLFYNLSVAQISGLGISVVSTSQGVISSKEARKRKAGGEILCNVW